MLVVVSAFAINTLLVNDNAKAAYDDIPDDLHTYLMNMINLSARIVQMMVPVTIPRATNYAI